MNKALRIGVIFLWIGMSLSPVPFARAFQEAESHEGCADTPEYETIAPFAVELIERIDSSSLSPNADFPYLTVRPGLDENFDRPGEKERLAHSRRLMEIAINSEAFKQKVLSHTVNGKTQFLMSQGKTNEQIYESIRQAQEVEFGQELYTAEFNNRLRDMSGGVVGSTIIGQPWITTNTDFFRYDSSFNDAIFAGHIAHEWMHLLGYLHGRRSPHQGTVPYDIGTIVAQIAAQIVTQ